MRICKTELYTFDELPEEAKQNAIDEYRANSFEYAWIEEWRDTLTEFCKATGITVTDWSASPHDYSSISGYYKPDYCEATDIKGLRLRTWLINNLLPEFAKGKWYTTSFNRKTNTLNLDKHGKSRHSNIQFKYDEYALTGFYADYDITKPILDFVANPNETTDLEDIVNACLDSWLSGLVDDMASQEIDEYIADLLIANEYEFTSAGKYH